VLAEGFPLLLEGMRHVFESESGFRVLATCVDGAETLRAVRAHHPDVLVVDLEMPGGGLRILRELAAGRCGTRVVLLAAAIGEGVMLEAMRLGAQGIILKSMTRQLLIQCVRKVHRGGAWVEKVSMSRALEQLLRHEAGYRHAAALLSPREMEVVRLLVNGRSNKEIADTLSISDGTVKVHLHHVYEKLGVKGRLELTLYARDKALFSPLMPEMPFKSTA
jgi:DNA-binding NarL/FixJ family response regulator